jgi:hypothetical protein
MYFANLQKNTVINITHLGNSVYFDMLYNFIKPMASNDDCVQKFIVSVLSFVDCFCIPYMFKN